MKLKQVFLLLLIHILINISWASSYSEDEPDEQPIKAKDQYTVQLLNERILPQDNKIREGQLSVIHEQENKAVCEYEFDENDAHVACVELGYFQYAYYQGGQRCYRDNQEIMVGKIECEGQVADDTQCQGKSRCILIGCAQEGWTPPSSYKWPKPLKHLEGKVDNEKKSGDGNFKESAVYIVVIILLFVLIIGMTIGICTHRKDLIRTIEELKESHKSQMDQVKINNNNTSNNIVISGPQKNNNNSAEEISVQNNQIYTEQTKRRISNQATNYDDSQKLLPQSNFGASQIKSNQVMPGTQALPAQFSPVAIPQVAPQQQQMGYSPNPAAVYLPPQINVGMAPVSPAHAHMNQQQQQLQQQFAQFQPVSDPQINFNQRKEEYKQYQLEQINNVFKTHDPAEHLQVKPNTFFSDPNNSANIKQVTSQVVNMEQEQPKNSQAIRKIESQVINLDEQQRLQQFQQQQQMQSQMLFQQQQQQQQQTIVLNPQSQQQFSYLQPQPNQQGQSQFQQLQPTSILNQQQIRQSNLVIQEQSQEQLPSDINIPPISMAPQQQQQQQQQQNNDTNKKLMALKSDEQKQQESDSNLKQQHEQIQQQQQQYQVQKSQQEQKYNQNQNNNSQNENDKNINLQEEGEEEEEEEELRPIANYNNNNLVNSEEQNQQQKPKDNKKITKSDKLNQNKRRKKQGTFVLENDSVLQRQNQDYSTQNTIKLENF